MFHCYCRGDMDDIERLCEWIERDAWLDLHAAAPSEVRAKLGIEDHKLGAGAVALVVRALPVPQFNRVFGLGIDRPATEQDLDGALSHLGPGGYVQITPK